MERLNHRLNRALAAGALVLVLAIAASGCRSTRSEVPPGRGYKPGSGQTPPLSFSNQPGNNAMNALPPTAGGGDPAANARFGTPAPSGTPYGAPTTNAYGPPGTSGMAGTSSPGATTASGLPTGAGGLGASPSPLTGIGAAADPAAAPASAPSPLQKPF